MHPAAEGKMAGLTASDVELLWGVEHLWIVVSGTEQQHNALAFGDALPADLYILERRVKSSYHGRIIAQHFLRRRVHKVRVRAELLQLVWMAQQGQHAIANEVRGRLIARNQEQTQHDEELIQRQLIAGFLCRH